MNEAGVVGKIREAIRAAYPSSVVFKIHGSPYQEAGIPDLLACVQGYFFGFEVKHQKPGESREHAYGRTTPVQQAQINRINQAGGTALTVLGPDEALAAIAQRLENSGA